MYEFDELQRFNKKIKIIKSDDNFAQYYPIELSRKLQDCGKHRCLAVSRILLENGDEIRKFHESNFSVLQGRNLRS